MKVVRGVLLSVIVISFSLSYGLEVGDVRRCRAFRVSDGDTFHIEVDGKREAIRLFGVDCPEDDQPFGKFAKSFTEMRVLEKVIQITVRDIDRYGRLVCEVDFSFVDANGNVVHQDLSSQLIGMGLGWWYSMYAPNRKDYESSERQSRSEKRGLWFDDNAVPPWEWRKLS